MKQEQKTHVSADALIQLLKGAKSIRWQLALGVLMSLVLVVCALVIPTRSLWICPRPPARPPVRRTSPCRAI